MAALTRRSTTPTLCKACSAEHTIKNSDCWLDCCYLNGASCCPVNLLPADTWQADDTWPRAPWDKACPTSTDEPAVQLKRHLIHQQCTTISTLQQPALRSQGTHTCKQASSTTKWGSPLHTSCPQEVCEQSIATHHQSTNPHAFC